MQSKHLPFFIIIGLIYLCLDQISPVYFKDLAQEDGLIENIGAISFFLTAIGFGYLYFKSKGRPNNRFFGKQTHRNIYFGLLALLFVVVGGEEISWGQRIIGWETPEAISKLNRQNETNIHNLSFFDASSYKDGYEKSAFHLLFDFTRLFSIFWMITCVIIPLLHKYSKKAKSLIDYIGIPIAPLWIGGLFLFNYLLFKGLLTVVYQYDYHDPMTAYYDETKESIYGLIFLALAVHFYLKSKATNTANLTDNQLFKHLRRV